jgi:hypothetical protein
MIVSPSFLDLSIVLAVLVKTIAFSSKKNYVAAGPAFPPKKGLRNDGYIRN